jgi:hypothetical protein
MRVLQWGRQLFTLHHPLHTNCGIDSQRKRATCVEWKNTEDIREMKSCDTNKQTHKRGNKMEGKSITKMK